MNYFNNLLEKRNYPQLALSILFMIYLLLNLKMPKNIANVVDTLGGKIIISIISLYIVAFSNPILGGLAIAVAYTLITKSGDVTGTNALANWYPAEEKVWSPYTPKQQFPYTLEQEVVKKMTTTKFNSSFVKAPYKPVLDDNHDASMLNAQH